MGRIPKTERSQTLNQSNCVDNQQSAVCHAPLPTIGSLLNEIQTERNQLITNLIDTDDFESVFLITNEFKSWLNCQIQTGFHFVLSFFCIKLK